MGRAEISSSRPSKRHPLDWYVDEIWCARQLAWALDDFRREREQDLWIWDPSCGLGNTLQAAWERGLGTIGSDLVENMDWASFEAGPELVPPVFMSRDFLEMESAPTSCSIVCNPPYSYLKVQGVPIAELFARHALKLVRKCGGGRVCLLLPTKWLASQQRFRLFMEDAPPAAILQLTQRPSMPPGDMIARMGGRAFRGGMIDYCWIVWDVQRPTAPGQTRIVWLPPLGAGRFAPIEGVA